MQAFHFDVVDSTNELAKRLIASGEIRGPAYITAREQTNGKGSRGRTWVSPRDGGLYMTVIGLPAQPLDCRTTQITDFTLAAGVACAEALAKTPGIGVELKPINDLYVGEKKLGGILTELVIESGQVKAVIIGIGINIHCASRPLPAGHVLPACLEELLGRKLSQPEVSDIRGSVVQQAWRWLERVMDGRAGEIRDHWRRHARPGSELPG
jgi:BirA family biotin operon repressor/biotin-[acetyl-CoA-carboxylase] ligase